VTSKKIEMKKILNLKFVFTICGLVLLLLTSLMLEDDKYVQTGKASYYSRKFQGRETSSGEVFKHNKYTAAHKTLPFGSIVRVVNMENDSIVYVKINDRLPKTSKRLIDLTRKAAKELNFIHKGLTKVTVERVL
jgi:rare lipoprotein A